MHKHKEGETCAVCAGVDLERWQAEMMEKHGWYIHAVMPEPGENNWNVHTHGIPEKFPGQLDLQVVLPVDYQRVSMPLIHNAVRLMEEGVKLSDGDEVERIAQCKVRLVQRWEGGDSVAGRAVLRILLPDPEFRFPGDPGCQEIYEEQLEG